MPFAALVFWAHKIDHLGLPSIFHFFQVFIPNGLISGAPVIQIIMTYSRLTPEKLQHACLPKAGSQGLMHYGEIVMGQNWVLRAQVRGLVQQPSLAYGFAAKTNIPSCFIFQLMTSHSVPAVSSSHFLPRPPGATRRLLWCWLR